MLKKFPLAVALMFAFMLVAFNAPARAQDGHEYAPLMEKTINYQDWTFKSLKDGAPVNLRQWAKGKKLVMVVYYAPWCGNWKMEAPVVARLYDKYKDKGFDVIAVNEYGSLDAAREFFGTAGAPYAVVVESEARDAREQTTHYGYRQACGDTRRWGSPFNIFLDPSKLNQTGNTLAEKAFVVGGELVEKDVEQFIRQRLNVSENAGVESCTEKPTTKQ
jgi:thiol-disulfide isomerase/thioredoxin